MINSTTKIDTSPPSPELRDRFGFTKQQANFYREQLVRGNSEGVFLYEWKDSEDNDGIESGGYYYNKVANSEGYNVSAIESLILDKMGKVWKRLAKRKNHIELGTAAGKANKFKNVIFPGFGKKRKDGHTHIDVDSSTSLIDSCVPEYLDMHDLSFFPFVQDRRKKGVIDQIRDKAYYRLGGSIGNFSEDQVVEILRNLSSDSNWVGREIIISHFLRPEEPNKQQKIEQLKAQYSGSEVQEWIMKGFMSLGFDSQDLSFAVEYEPGISTPDRIKVGAKLLKDTWVDIGGGEKVLKHAGEHLWAISSRRYTKEQFGSLAEKAGCSLEESFIAEDQSMAVSVLKTPRKPLQLTQKVLLGVAAALILVLGSIEITKYQERAKRQKKQEEIEHDLKLTLGCSNDVYFNQLLDEILNDLEVRCGNHLTQDQKILLTGKVLDFFSRHHTLLTYNYGGGQGMMYSTNLYTPSMMDKFVAENINGLASMRLLTIPNSPLLEYPEALTNSYYYEGERQQFSQIDQQLPDYVSEGSGVSQDDGKPIYFTYPCGIKYIDGKPYFVVKRAGAEGYMLEEKTPNLHSNGGLCAGDIVTEILARGQAQIFAQRIQDFLQLRYGDKMVAAMNGQDVIASFLIDLYAQGRDFDYLFGSTNDTSDPYWYLRDSPLHNFVLMYVLPAIGDKLVNGVDGVYGSIKMYDLDMEKISVDQQKLVDVSLLLPEVYNFVNFYIPKYTHNFQAGKVKSIIMKHLLLDPAVGKLDINDKHSLRAWVTIHAQEFKDDGIQVPIFPNRVDDFLTEASGPTYYPSDDLQGISGKDAHAGGQEQIQFGSYVDIDGNEYDLGVYMVSFFKGKVVGRINNQSSDTHLLRRWQQGEFGTITIQTPRGNIPLTNESDLLLGKLRDKAITYSSAPVGRLLDDYQQRKAAMEKFNE